MKMTAESETAGDTVDPFHALLPALAQALDVRDIFQHLSAVSSQIVPHDEASLALVTDDGSRYRLYATTGTGDPDLVCREDGCTIDDPIVPGLIDHVPG